ncbi:excisionase family DNA binding protein [Bradyrhizobium sp. S3.9.2]|uniref:helix-turn-helix domain-containing protein n=1 Tax=Bradyrhizobium sp. S3.9.2 TaxID=3156432 RepID=UPI0033948551
MLDYNVDLAGVPFEERSFGVKEAAKILGISRTRVFEKIGTGALRSYKDGGSRRVTGKALKLYRESLEAEAEAQAA